MRTIEPPATVAPGASRRILLVEDNRTLALGLRVNLEEHGYLVSHARTLSEGAARIRRERPDLVLLDLSLPDGDGLRLLRQLRADGDDTLVLVLTARVESREKVIGLRDGADDYVTKPFDLDELLARTASLLRRARGTERAARSRIGADDAMAAAPHHIGDAVVDPKSRTIRRGDVQLPVSRTAFDLLLALLRRRRSVVTRAELMQQVWGYDARVVSRTLDTHIFELRRLLEPDPGAPTHIRTVWGVGYRLD